MRTDYRILICEPVAKSRHLLMANFGASAHQFVWSNSGAETIQLLESGTIDAALLMVSTDGLTLDVFDWKDRTGCAVPVLVATPGNALDMRLLALERGAADYLIKPFSMNELVARVTTVMHRRHGLSEQFALRGGLKLDMETGCLGDDKQWITLTPKERQAFSLLLQYGTRPTPKSRLKEAVANGKSVTDNALEVVIFRLRAKASRWGMNIRVLRGSGYLLEYA